MVGLPVRCAVVMTASLGTMVVVCVSCHSSPASPSVNSLVMHLPMMAARLVSAVVFVIWLGDSVGQLHCDEWDTWSPSCSW